MSDLSFTEKARLEKLFGMSSGYVLDFSNRTFQEFVADSVQRDIYSNRYDSGSGSKANRLRAFWAVEANHVVGKLIADLLQYCRDQHPDPPKQLLNDCCRIAERLRQGAPVLDIEALDSQLGEKAFTILTRSVKQAIDAHEPETGLDRLHTYVVKYMRWLCDRHGIGAARDKPLHSLVGEYIKHMKAQGRIESEMTERILKSSISTMEAFNRVRNEQSLAHDNPILNYNESLLILNHVVSAIRFLQGLECETRSKDDTSETASGEDIPF